MAVKEWHVAAAALAGGLIVAFGFATPASRIDAQARDISNAQAKLSEHDTEIAVLKTDISYIKDGIDQILGRHRRAKAP